MPLLGPATSRLGEEKLLIAAVDQALWQSDERLVNQLISLEERAHGCIKVLHNLFVRDIRRGVLAQTK
jgi:hypothetical protein